MPRIRTIKPDAFLSESLSSVPRGTRWTFAGLWTYADDAGRARDDARLIKAALYPLDDDTTLEDVAHDLDLLTGIGGICRYVVDGRRYLHMPKWEHQKINRPTPAKSPPCPVHEEGVSGHLLDSDGSVTAHGGITESSTWEKEGKGREKEEGGGTAARKRTARHLPDDFRPTEDHVAIAAGLGIDLDREFDKFCDYWRGEGKPKADWNATLRNWLRRAGEDRRNVRPAPVGGSFPHEGTQAEKDAWVAAQPLPTDGAYYGGSRR